MRKQPTAVRFARRETNEKTAAETAEAVRVRRLREDAQRPLSVNLAETIWTSCKDWRGVPSFAELNARASQAEVLGVNVAVCSVEDLRAMKQAAGRGQDLVDLESLDAAEA